MSNNPAIHSTRDRYANNRKAYAPSFDIPWIGTVYLRPDSSYTHWIGEARLFRTAGEALEAHRAALAC